MPKQVSPESLERKAWVLFLAVCLLTLAVAPMAAQARGVPFVSKNQVDGLQYELLTLNNDGLGSNQLTIAPTNFTIAPNGKHVRFEISFIPDPSSSYSAYGTMSSIISIATNTIFCNANNNDGSTLAIGHDLTPGATLDCGYIYFIGHLNVKVPMDNSALIFLFKEDSTAPKGTYFVKIFY